jgi:pyruvate/2-oxoacid:ferredoxin oxidoreductase beta subunit/Pyruvate/2-oxoacid:ferredoxin oxidoreductase gamma subunit
MSDHVVISKAVPFCPGCGHTVVSHALDKALSTMDVDPLDVVLVSDIGCCGMIDGILACHTVHGLHGRSTALGLGIALGMDDPRKRVIVIQGDGGATIGLQHLLEAARQNVDMTLIVHNNMVYGMTGGQVSGLTSPVFREQRLPDRAEGPAFDIVTLAHHAGAATSARAFVDDDVAGILQAAIQTPGFSLVEIVEMCPAHGVGKVRDLHAMSAYESATHTNERSPGKAPRRDTEPLLQTLPRIERRFEAALHRPVSLVVAGSAGEGVQGAADLLAMAGVASGLHASKKGEFPVTVGTGFSVAEVILSPEPIHCTGIRSADVMMVVSEDGLRAVQPRVAEAGLVMADITLPTPKREAPILAPYRKTGGPKGAALAAIAHWLRLTGAIPVAALEAAAHRHKHGDKMRRTIQESGSLVVPGY